MHTNVPGVEEMLRKYCHGD